MSSSEYLQQANSIIQTKLGNRITESIYRPLKGEYRYQLKNGIVLFIRYNDILEYGYSIIFSKRVYDRIRFDNLDDQWEVKTRPHHKHLRGKKIAIESEMQGTPKDMEVFCQEILKHIR